MLTALVLSSVGLKPVLHFCSLRFIVSSVIMVLAYREYAELKRFVLESFDDLDDWVCILFGGSAAKSSFERECVRNLAILKSADEVSEMRRRPMFVDLGLSSPWLLVASKCPFHSSSSSSTESLSRSCDLHEEYPHQDVGLDLVTSYQWKRRGLKYFVGAFYFDEEISGLEFASFLFPAFHDDGTADIYYRPECQRLFVAAHTFCHRLICSAETQHATAPVSQSFSVGSSFVSHDNSNRSPWMIAKPGASGIPSREEERLGLAGQRAFRQRCRVDFPFGYVYFIVVCVLISGAEEPSSCDDVVNCEPRVFFFACVCSKDYPVKEAYGFLEDMQSLYESQVGLEAVAKTISLRVPVRGGDMDRQFVNDGFGMISLASDVWNSKYRRAGDGETEIGPLLSSDGG